MSDWLHNLPVGWMALLIFGFTYVLTFGIYLIVSLTAHGERARSFKAACWASSHKPLRSR